MVRRRKKEEKKKRKRMEEEARLQAKARDRNAMFKARSVEYRMPKPVVLTIT